MAKFIVKGGKRLSGDVSVSGAKNVALKALVAACLTTEEVTIENIPLISDFFIMTDLIEELGGTVEVSGHTAKVYMPNIKNIKISLDKAAEIRTSSMFLAPLLARKKEAVIPNPGGCRIGARPIDRTVKGLEALGVTIAYSSDDGYFHAKTDQLQSASYTFEKSTHTGTETLILTAVLAKGKTILKNAGQEPEIDELVRMLNSMGAKITRVAPRVIEIEGVDRMHATKFVISPDRNEIVTLAIAAIITRGDIFIHGAKKEDLVEFLTKLEEAGAGVEEKENGIRFYYKGQLKATSVTTAAYPGFMTDWQAPWAVLMTQAEGTSVIHETVYENRFGYVSELKKMGAHIRLFNPKVDNPKAFYNFNLDDDSKTYFHGAEIKGPVNLHDAIVFISDLRAGATLVIAALTAKGESVIHGIEKLDRGYEQFDKRLEQLGASINRAQDNE